MPDSSSRLDALELAVARLTREMVLLRNEVGALRERPSSESARRAPSAAPSDAMGASGVAGAEEGAPAAAREAARPAAPGAESGSGDAARPTAPYVSDELRRMAMGVPPAAGSNSGSPRWDAVRAASGGRGESRAKSEGLAGAFQRQSLEALVGRYGTLALAAFTILMGVGAFIGWAVRNGLIGPELRVALGVVAAAVVAFVGWRLRRGESPRFGNVLLALALAIMHVVCWGAGPLLQLVPAAVALGVAAAASAGLAALALAEEDQALFNVGFGGALLAPFVTSSDTGDAVVLLMYGALVLGAGMRAMRDREWSKTPFVLGLGIMAYTAAASGQLAASEVWVRASAPSMFAVAMAWLSLLLVQGKPRERLAVASLLAATGALSAMPDRNAVAVVRYSIAALVTATGFVVGRAPGVEWVVRVASALLLPMAGFIVALQSLRDVASVGGVATAAAWAAACAIAAYHNLDGARPWHAFMAAAIGGFTLAFYFENEAVAFAIGIAVYGATVAILMRRLEQRGVGLATFLWLSVGATVAFMELDGRARWLTTPFLTPPSAAALAVCAAWLTFSWHAARTGAADGGVTGTSTGMLVRVLGGILTFLWIHAELSRTVSIDVATFLLVAYYAVSGVVAIGIGRWRGIPLLRQLGLALSVFAAFKALAETASLSIGWKVGGYLLAGGFLLAVAYWYRGTQRADARLDGADAPDDAGQPTAAQGRPARG